MASKGGRKIKRSKNLYGNRRRSRIKSVVTVLLLLVAVGGLVFLGYSLGKPIMDYFTNRETTPSSESSPWTPDDVPPAAETTVSETAAPAEDSSQEQPSLLGKQVFLPGDALGNIDTLNAALDSAMAQGAKSVVVPCKLPGGRLTYRSELPQALEAGVSNAGGMSPLEICAAVTAKGLTPIAEVNVLTDNMLPLYDKSSGYTFQGQESSWYDNTPSAGGKPWLSPFSLSAKAYLNALANELYDGGFQTIICSDLIFPSFRATDLSYVGEIVQTPDRYKALINVVGEFQQSAQDREKTLSIQVPARGVVEGNAEVFHPTELPGINAVVYYSVGELGSAILENGVEVSLADMLPYDKAKLIFEKVLAAAGDMSITPCIVKENLLPEEIAEIERAFTDLGFTLWYLR